MNKINWYPGHMKKATDTIREDLKVIDVVIEILDARVPLSSKNPVLDSLPGTSKSAPISRVSISMMRIMWRSATWNRTRPMSP